MLAVVRLSDPPCLLLIGPGAPAARALHSLLTHEAGFRYTLRWVPTENAKRPRHRGKCDGAVRLLRSPPPVLRSSLDMHVIKEPRNLKDAPRIVLIADHREGAA